MAYVGIDQKAITNNFAYSDTSNNGCGQAAVATLIQYWGRNPYAVNPVKEIYDRYKPDINIIPWTNINMGSTPGHVENICRAYGLKTLRRDNRAYNGNVDLIKHDLKVAIQNSQPVIVLVDKGKLNGPWGAHYLIVYGYDDEKVYCANSIVTRGFRNINWNQFMDAWHFGITTPLGKEFQYSFIVCHL